MPASDYPANSVKREPTGTGSFAIRTPFSDGRDWRIVDQNAVYGYVSHEQVADWTDMADT